MKKIISVILSLIFVILALSACGTPGEGDETSTAPAALTTGQPEETAPLLDEWGREIVEDGIPETLRFEGSTLGILSRSDSGNRWQIDFYAKEENGTTLNDAVYRRNERVKYRLGIEIEVTERDGSYTVFSSNYAPFITAAFQSGSSDLDVVGTYSLYGAQYATQGYFANVLDLSPYLDLSKVWWNANLVNDMTINDTLYFLVGDMNITTLTRMLVTFFNKTLLASKMPEVDLYKTVLDGNWTIDYYATLVSDLYDDVNGNQKADSDDRFGIVSTAPSEAYDGLAVSLDIPVIIRDSDGNWTINDNSERFIEAIEKTANLYFGGTNNAFFTDLGTVQSIFASDRAYFMSITLDKASESYLTGMTSDYGILPDVKLNSDQENYYTVPQDAFNLISVMGNTDEPDMVAAALTLLCAETYREVTPKYFEEVMKYRYARDNESSQMLDICRAGLRMDFATVNTLSLGDPGRWFRNTMHAGQATAGKGAATKIRTSFKSFATYLEKFTAGYGAH
ncbi:MAG: hypothetical protein ILP01_03495 [Clostridia bacterium]|nr:hypothetical protein [Clostridia bacterium]